MKKIILLAIAFLLLGCLTGCAAWQNLTGTADKSIMMSKWRGKPVTENLLADINGWGNWYKKGKPSMPVAYLDAPQWERDLKAPNKVSGGCAAQADVKAKILEELGIPHKVVHCEIIRNDPYHPSGHAFVIAQLNNKWMVLDNGSVCDAVFPFDEVKKSVSGVINYRVSDD